MKFYRNRVICHRGRCKIILLTEIKKQVLPVTVIAVVLTIGYFFFIRMPPRGTVADIIAWVMLLLFFSILFSVIPAIAILYGWYTGNPAGALLLGTFLFPALYLLASVVFWLQGSLPAGLLRTILFVLVLSAVGGLAGFCAAQRMKKYLAFSVILSGLWLIIWMAGIN